jgi:predicted transcriptional regulator
MEIIKLGRLEEEVLEYLVKNNDKILSEIVVALDKTHNSEIMQPLNTLMQKGLVEIKGKMDRVGKGRPPSIYGETEEGVIYLLILTQKNVEEILRQNQHYPQIKFLYYLYTGLKAENHPNVDDFILKGIGIMFSLVTSAYTVTKDTEDVKAMFQAWLDRRIKPGSRKRNRLNKHLVRAFTSKDMKKMEKKTVQDLKPLA